MRGDTFVSGAMSDKLVGALFCPPSSSESHSRSRAGSRSRSRSRAGSRSRSRIRSRACSRSRAGRSRSGIRSDELAAEAGAGSEAGPAAEAEAGAGSDPRSRSMAGSRSRSRAGTKSRTIDRCKIASRIAANAVAEAGSTSEEEPPRATGDELLDLLQDFDPDDSDIERCLEHEKQSAKELEDISLRRKLEREAAAASEAAAARAEEEQLELLEIAWKRDVAATQGLPIEWPEFVSAALIVGDSIEPLQLRIACHAHDRDFYIGGTASVRRRWLGGFGMQGHAETFERMLIIGIANGRLGGRMEAHLIKYSKDITTRCLNKASDSRGLTAGTNFIYMCLQ